MNVHIAVHKIRFYLRRHRNEVASPLFAVASCYRRRYTRLNKAIKKIQEDFFVCNKPEES